MHSSKEITMGLKGSKTEQNLKDAFAGESQANRRYLYFANKADIEGQNDVAALFRSTAEGETGHAHGHLEFLEAVGDPATGMPIGSSRQNLAAAVAGETHEYTDMYPGMAKSARDEGFDEIADWFETLAKAERSHANRTPPDAPRMQAQKFIASGLHFFRPKKDETPHGPTRRQSGSPHPTPHRLAHARVLRRGRL
jgi:rubrerythrin